MFTYMYNAYNKYGYGRHMVTVRGDLAIWEVEEFIEKKKGIEKVLVTGFFEMSEEDYNASSKKDKS